MCHAPGFFLKTLSDTVFCIFKNFQVHISKWTNHKIVVKLIFVLILFLIVVFLLLHQISICICIFEVLGRATSQVIGARNEWLWMIMMAKCNSGTVGSKASCHLSYRWGKTPKKPHPRNLSRPGIEPWPAAWQARMLPPVPHRWTYFYYHCPLHYTLSWPFKWYIKTNRNVWIIFTKTSILMFLQPHMKGDSRNLCLTHPKYSSSIRLCFMTASSLLRTTEDGYS